jgi:hypothetical protein
MAEFASTKARRSSVESVRAVAMLVFMLGGAEVMVSSSLGVAKHLGFSDGLAGLTLVGIGTSAPLIAASIQAARKGEHDLVVGNVLGGNLFIALGGGAVIGLFASSKSGHVGDVALVLMAAVVAASWLAMARGRPSDARKRSSCYWRMRPAFHLSITEFACSLGMHLAVPEIIICGLVPGGRRQPLQRRLRHLPGSAGSCRGGCAAYRFELELAQRHRRPLDSGHRDRSD